MPLDRYNGERLDGLEGQPVTIPTRALAELTNVKTTIEVRHGLRRIKKTLPIMADAVACALRAFDKAGSLSRKAFDEDDMLVQLYPDDAKVIVLFQRRIAGTEYYYHRAYDLPRQVIPGLLEYASKPPRRH